MQIPKQLFKTLKNITPMFILLIKKSTFKVWSKKTRIFFKPTKDSLENLIEIYHP